jgi:low affinity Fe/Cu permease
MNNWFRSLSNKVSSFCGTPAAFFIALSLVVVWASFGPKFGWSDTHSLFINTVTTIVTFLMVFLIQNTQNRDSRSIHLKLDELIRSIDKARNSMIDLDKLSDDEIKELEKEYCAITDRHKKDDEVI